MGKITVISQKGKLVGSWIRPQSAPAGDPISTPVAGTGQRLHELDIDAPESYVRRKALPELHRIVKKSLRLK